MLVLPHVGRCMGERGPAHRSLRGDRTDWERGTKRTRESTGDKCSHGASNQHFFWNLDMLISHEHNTGRKEGKKKRRLPCELCLEASSV
jgi:hypothetical protein